MSSPSSSQKGEVDTERFLHIASHVPAGVAGQIETVKEASRMEGLRAALGSALRWYEDEEHEGSKGPRRQNPRALHRPL